jgi:hypothetical protein
LYLKSLQKRELECKTAWRKVSKHIIFRQWEVSDHIHGPENLFPGKTPQYALARDRVDLIAKGDVTASVAHRTLVAQLTVIHFTG